jgi:hypothetical protein
MIAKIATGEIQEKRTPPNQRARTQPPWRLGGRAVKLARLHWGNEKGLKLLATLPESGGDRNMALDMNVNFWSLI